MPWPSSLPSFMDLVKAIRDESNLHDQIGDLKDQPLDEVLGRINDEFGVDVHGRIHDHLSKPGTRPSPVHKAVVDLASASTVRIVTTNYDHHLSTLFDQRRLERAEYFAPALPVGDDFDGVVYIHGRLDQEPHRLVATDDDFGKAYLTDAWAARFLDRMFAARPVLFVGYSHKDTIMKYLARGLGGRSEKRYAITDDPDSNLWRQLGITPIQSSHADIAPALSDWAARASGGLLGHRARVKALVADQDPTPVPETVSYLESIIGDEHTVRFFTEHARGKLWLQWAATRPEFATLFYPSPDVEAKITHELARWFAENYISDDELSDVALLIVAEANTTPGHDLLFEICRRLAREEWPLPERLRRWLLIVTGSPGTNYTIGFLGSMLRRSSLTDDPDTALFLLDYLTEPIVRPSHQIFGATFEVASRESDVTLKDVWETVFRPALSDHVIRLLDIADRHLRRSDLQLAVANESDRRRPSDWRAAIEHLGVYEINGPLGFLIDVARECIDYLVAGDHPVGYARLDSWAASENILLRRLAVRGWTRRTDKTASEKLEWFLASGWLTAYELRSETTYLVTQAVLSAEPDTVAALIASIVEHSEDDDFAPRRAWSLLASIDASTPHNDAVGQAMTNLAQVHPEIVDRPQPDVTKKQSAWAAAPPTTINELHEKISQDIAATSEAITACEAESSSFDDRDRWESLTGAISETVRNWPEDGFALIDSVGSGHPNIDQAVVRGWSMVELNADLAGEIFVRIAALDLAPILGYVTGPLGGYTYAGSQPPRWFMFDESEQLARRCWEVITADTASGLENSDDPVLEANNHPAGHLARYWVDRLGHLWRNDPDRWDGIPPDISDHLAEMLTGGTKSAEMVEVVFGQQLVFLYEADDDWCRHFLLPRFEWTNEDQARRSWEGYLSHGGWAKELPTEGFLANIVAATNHREKLSTRRAHGLSTLIARIALDGDIDPRELMKDLVRASSTDAHVAWTEAIGMQLRSLEPDMVESQWDTWMRDYVSSRISSVPRKLDPREATAIAYWLLFLGDSMAAAIELLLKSQVAGIDTHSLFFHDLTDLRIEQAPHQVAQLVRQLLESTSGSFHYLMDLKRIYAKLKALGVPEDTLHGICEAAMRLSIELE